MALKFTVHVVQLFIKGHRKSGVILIKHFRIELAHLQWNSVRFLPVTATIIIVIKLTFFNYIQLSIPLS